MGNTTPPSGPDLSKGVPLHSLAEGRPVLGQYAGEAVMLVRLGAEVLATGATCTHYSGPLAEGLVVGDTVRCPWHHACFSLRTGTSLSAPAFNAIPCYEVAIVGDEVRVTGKRGPHPGPGGNRALGGVADPSVRRVVIVGAGPAGAAAADVLRREGFTGELTLVSAHDPVPVDRPNLSKDYLAGTAPEEWMPLRTAEGWRELDVTLVTGQARRVDRQGRAVELAGGERVAFDRLLLATGATPRRPGIPGADLPHVFTLRTLADAKGIIAATAGARKAVVLGASFLGLEAAASLRTRGLEVTVVSPRPAPLHQLGPAIGAEVRRIHEGRGVTFRLGQSPASIDARSVRLASGEVVEADVVVLGVGVELALELASSAGLAIDRGVVVDERLETSAPEIFAAGDIARYPDERFGGRIRVEHWNVALSQGQVAARNILGQRVPYRQVPFFWSQHHDLPINVVGHAEAYDTIDVDGDVAAHDAAVAYRAGGRTLAVATLFRDQVSLEAEAALEANDQAALARLVRPRAG